LAVSALSERSAVPLEGERATGPTLRTRTSSSTKLVEALVAVGCAAAVLIAPLLIWIHVRDTETSARLSPSAAADVGARDAGLDPTVFPRIARIVPAHATYWIDTSSTVGSSPARQAFPVWASGALLPRIAVARLDEADWVVIWGYSPRRLPIEVAGLRVLAVRTPPRLPVYVARVAR
jgi:hypothetical protein